jgi:hypothetical protein
MIRAKLGTTARALCGVIRVRCFVVFLSLITTWPALASECVEYGCKIMYKSLVLGTETRLFLILRQAELGIPSHAKLADLSKLQAIISQLGLQYDIGKASNNDLEETLRELIKTKYSQEDATSFDIGLELTTLLADVVVFNERKASSMRETDLVKNWEKETLFINDRLSSFKDEAISKMVFDPKANSSYEMQGSICKFRRDFDFYLASVDWRCSELVDQLKLAATSPAAASPPIEEKVSSDEVPVEVKNVEVRYLKKAADYGLVEKALKDNHVPVKIYTGINEFPTNVISCSPPTRIEAVKFLAKLVKAAGVHLQGVVPQFPDPKTFVQLENYPSYRRMPELTDEQIDSLTVCPVYDDSNYPAPYISVKYNCYQPFRGIIEYTDVTMAKQTLEVFVPPNSTYFARSVNGYYYPSGASYFSIWRGSYWDSVRIGSDVDCSFSTLN